MKKTGTRSGENYIKYRRGFTLTELAIVLGIMGVIIAAVWAASSNVSEAHKESDAVTELQTVVQNMMNVYQGQLFATAAAPVNQTSTLIPAGVIPTSYVNAAVSTVADNPWDTGLTGVSNRGLIVYTNSTGMTATPARNLFRVSFYNPPSAGCLALILQATNCQYQQAGCPLDVITNVGGAICSPTGCTSGGVAAPTGTGWAFMTPTIATTLCALNTIAAAGSKSVEFDYSTQ